MADLLDEFDNPEIPTNRKGFFDSFLSGIDKPSNAMQGLFIEGLEGAQKGWNQERNYDYEELYTDEFRKNNPEFSYYSSGLLNLLADPLNFVPLGMLAKGAKASKGPVSYVADRALLAEMPNKLNSFGMNFYQGGKPGQVFQTGVGAGKGLLRSLVREFSPKQQKLFNKYGISTTTTKTIDDVLSKIDNPQLQEEMTALARKESKTPEEAKLLAEWNDLGKTLQGQLGWNYLERDAYDLVSAMDKYKDSHFFAGNLAPDATTFTQGVKEFSGFVNNKDMLSDDVLKTVFDKIMSNQGITNPNKTSMYFKKPAVSNANAVRIANEVAQKSYKRMSALKAFGGKEFKDINELSNALSKAEFKQPTMSFSGKKGSKSVKGIDHEIITGADGQQYAMFSESFVSGDNLLGGVNQINIVSPDGRLYSFVSDRQDLFGIGMPGGKTPLVVTPALPAHAVKGKTIAKTKPENLPKDGMMLGGPMTNPKSRPALSRELKEAAQQIQRLQKNINLNPLDYANLIGKVNLVTSPLQD